MRNYYIYDNGTIWLVTFSTGPEELEAQRLKRRIDEIESKDNNFVFLCYRCKHPIFFYQGYVSKRSKLIPLDYLLGQPHQHIFDSGLGGVLN